MLSQSCQFIFSKPTFFVIIANVLSCLFFKEVIRQEILGWIMISFYALVNPMLVRETNNVQQRGIHIGSLPKQNMQTVKLGAHFSEFVCNGQASSYFSNTQPPLVVFFNSRANLYRTMYLSKRLLRLSLMVTWGRIQ